MSGTLEEKLKKLREELLREFEKELERELKYISVIKENMVRRLDMILEAVKILPINILEYDIVNVEEKEISWDGRQNVYFDVYVPEKGKYKFIILGKKLDEVAEK